MSSNPATKDTASASSWKTIPKSSQCVANMVNLLSDNYFVAKKLSSWLQLDGGR
jgi:hypothetical protein